MNKTIKLPPDNITKLRAMNGVFGLTNRELTVLAAIITQDAVNPLSDRYQVAMDISMSVPVLNNVIKALADKGVLVRTKQTYIYHPLLVEIQAIDQLTLRFHE